MPEGISNEKNTAFNSGPSRIISMVKMARINLIKANQIF